MSIFISIATVILVLAVAIPIGNYLGIKINKWLQENSPNIKE